MLHYILKRFLESIFVLLAASFLIFILLRLAPGDPVDLMFGPSQGVESREQVSQETRERIREELGMDNPFWVQYGHWLNQVLHGNMGYSFRSRQPVFHEILLYLPATVSLALTAFAIELILVLSLGLLAASSVGCLTDRLIRLGAVFFRAIPCFWLGLLLIYLFAVKLKWVSVGGEASFSQVLLPAFTLAVVMAPRAMRVLRANLLTESNKLYIIFGRSKGLKNRKLLYHHALKNALLPTITLFGMSLSGLLSGSAFIETVFSWPGIGKFLVDAIYARDYPVVQAFVILATFIVVITNLVVDLSYTLLDPRIRFNGDRTFIS